MCCYNYSKPGHFACECTEPKNVYPCSIILNYAYISSCCLLIESCPMWTVDLGVTNYIARDRGAFVEFRRISPSTMWIYIGDNSKVEVKGIGTCKLMLNDGCTLLLHDVLYVLDI